MSIFSSVHPWGLMAATLPRPILMTQGWAHARPSRGDIHRGADLRVPVGTPVYAALSGTVQTAATGSPSAGTWIALAHSGGLVTRYLHLSELKVRVGQKVSRGQLIGLSGNTGNSSGPHLHADAYLPRSQLATYAMLFGTPKSGFGSGDPVKVPLEPMYVVDNYEDDVKAGAAAQGLKLKGAGSPLVLVALLGAAGYLGWRWYTGKPLLPRLGA